MLPLLLLLLALLGVLAAAGAAGAVRPFLPWGMAALCAVGLVLALASLLTGTEGELSVPAGPALLMGGAATSGTRLRLDALSALFLLPVFGAGTAAALHGAGLAAGRTRDAALPFAPALLVAQGLLLLAADAPTLLFGLGAAFAAACGAALVQGGAGARLAAAGLACAGLFGTGCLAAAFGLLAGDAANAAPASFGSVPDGWRGGAVLVLTLLGAGTVAALAPLHAWLPPAQAALSGCTGTLVGVLLPASGIYVLVRVLLHLGGSAGSAWWGMPLLLLGILSALLGAMRAVVEDEVPPILAAGTTAGTGLVTVALGVALVARGADLPALASLSASAALLLTAAQACGGTALLLAAGSVRAGAGSQRLDSLGGLAQRMPYTTGALLAGAASVAGVPLLAGFAGCWLLLQALLAAPRVGGIAVPLLFAVAAAGVAASVALRAAAMVRLLGVAALGRPRTPRAAAAEEVPLLAHAAALAAGGACILLGLLPGPLLLLADRALDRLVRGDVPGQAGWLRLAPAADAPGYIPLALFVLLAIPSGVAVLLLRRRGGEVRRVPAWSDGFDASAPWLPFGDPATQYGARSAAQPVATALGRTLLATQEHVEAAMPGQPAPARYRLRWRDPSSALARAAAGWAWRASLLLGQGQSLSSDDPHGVGASRRALAATFAALLAALLLAGLAGLRLTSLG